MKNYVFRITQDLQAFYEAKVSIKASSEKVAKNKLEKMSNKELNDIAFDWEQNTDDANPVGDINIHELIDEED